MSTSREEFLQNVRQAVAEGNRAGVPREASRRGSLGYQGAGGDPVGRFVQEFTNAGGQAHVVHDDRQALEKILEIVRQAAVQKIILGQGPVLTRIGVGDTLKAAGLGVWQESPPCSSSPELKDTLFQANLGITGVDHLVAETGSIVLASKPGQSRSLSLLPPVHIAVAERRQILPDLFDSFDEWQKRSANGGLDLPACITFITGPSKTGDIELRLVTGVHGPGKVHVVLIDAD